MLSREYSLCTVKALEIFSSPIKYNYIQASQIFLLNSLTLSADCKKGKKKKPPGNNGRVPFLKKMPVWLLCALAPKALNNFYLVISPYCYCPGHIFFTWHKGGFSIFAFSNEISRLFLLHFYKWIQTHDLVFCISLKFIPRITTDLF